MMIPREEEKKGGAAQWGGSAVARIDEEAYIRQLQEQNNYETCVKCARRFTPQEERDQ